MKLLTKKGGDGGGMSFGKDILSHPSTSKVAALAFLGVTLCYLFAQQPPVGSVKGRVLMSENRQVLENAEIELAPVRSFGTRRAKSGKDGSFTINRVPA